MRNVFDQYTQPENRLTHAVLASLDADRRLLREFINWIPCATAPNRQLIVLEQSLPGQVEDAADPAEVERRGLPDGWIHNDEGWALLIESKVGAAPDADQIRRHLRMAIAREGLEVTLLWLTVVPVRSPLAPGVVNRTWAELYEWLTHPRRRSEWARRAAQYFEVAEVQADMKMQLKEGTLTRFAGIPFGTDVPYNYIQAKRILGLLRDRLAGRGDLKRTLGADPAHTGRGAIKGTRDLYVWDFVALRDLEGSRFFTRHPHLTLAITNTQLEAVVTFPNNMPSSLRNQILGEEYESFASLVLDTTNRIVGALRGVKGSIPQMAIVQRRYSSMSAQPTYDATMRFDPRTAFKLLAKPSRATVRYQPEWLNAVYRALRPRRSNLQFQIGAIFPYRQCPAVQDASIENVVANTWIACAPLIKAAREQ